MTRTTKETIDIDGSSNPIGVFVFKYRSRGLPVRIYLRPKLMFATEDLQSELVIPRSPTPEPVPAPNSHSRTNANIPNDRDARLAQLKVSTHAYLNSDTTNSIQKEMADIKAEADEEGSRGQKRDSDADFVPSGRAFKTSRRRDGKVVVDLTDD